MPIISDRDPVADVLTDAAVAHERHTVTTALLLLARDAAEESIPALADALLEHLAALDATAGR